ncbi:glycosyltransferase [Methylobacterium sp. J-068]|uniref:glycosyltransferase n=1 Tax=Methylobacterium sp. J-068 TaxID=2836649 RepID=UPI001FB960D1|nr:glycosyltransferase [Methylobacterium sp. J-068]MCJ2033232.1 glycosyltransferase [Methylobacterium sp. J-068]
MLNHDFSNGTDNWAAPSALPGSVNFSTDFAESTRLEGKSVAYLTGEADVPSFSVSYRDPELGDEFPVVPGKAYRFKGYFAAHRALGRVEITFLDAQQKTVHVLACPLTEHEGGANASDWQQVDLSAMAPPSATAARLGIRFVRSQNSVRGMNFFLFFTDLSLTIGDGSPIGGGHSSDDAWTRSLIAISGGRSALQIFEAEVDTEALNRHRSVVKVVSSTDSAEAFTLYDAADVFSGSQVDFALEQGRLIRVSLRGISGCSLYCDGVRLDNLVQWADGTNLYFKLPDALLDHRVHLFEVRDPLGLTILARDYHGVSGISTPWHILQEHSGAVLPAHLAPAASDRYRALQAHLQSGASETSRQQLLHAHRVVTRGFDFNREFLPLTFPAHEAPTVSIVIPVHNKFEVTYFCLCALILGYNRNTYEVIVVDDGSKDRTKELAGLVAGIRIVRNDVGLGFVGACNRGAEEARGKFVVFLNNDTEPTAGWLDELVESFDTFDQVGLAGSKLVYPNGVLQEAGGIVWGSGNPWNYGRGQNPHDPRYTYTRQADYLSGAAIMLPTAVWKEIGGFSTEFMPAYFEDTDLAFKVRDHGYKTLYVASSVVYHFEGITSGTDVSSGAKRNQEINRPKFKSKWTKAYRNHGREGEKPDLEKDRGISGRVLFVDYQTPKPDIDAGSYAAIQEMRMVQALGYKVSFVPQNLAYLGGYTESLQKIGVETYYAPFYQSISEVLERHGHEFDAIYMTRYYVASDCIGAARRWAPQAKLIMNNADLHFLRELRAAINTGDQSLREKALRVRDEELAIMRLVDLVLSYNNVEHAVIMSHNLDASPVMYVPWVERVSETVPAFESRSHIAFLGGFNHHPNREAVAFFVKSVMPILRSRNAGVQFDVYGSNVSKEIEALSSDDVVVKGYVTNVSEVYDHCLVFVAPLTSGAGIKGKVISALAHGVPCVLSPLAAEGTGLRHGYDCLIADTPQEWAESIAQLLENREMWSSFSKRGQDLVRSLYAFDVGVKTMRRAFESVGLYTQ